MRRNLAGALLTLAGAMMLVQGLTEVAAAFVPYDAPGESVVELAVIVAGVAAIGACAAMLLPGGPRWIQVVGMLAGTAAVALEAELGLPDLLSSAMDGGVREYLAYGVAIAAVSACFIHVARRSRSQGRVAVGDRPAMVLAGLGFLTWVFVSITGGSGTGALLSHADGRAVGLSLVDSVLWVYPTLVLVAGLLAALVRRFDGHEDTHSGAPGGAVA